MDRARWTRARASIWRVLGIGVSWALVWLGFCAILGVLMRDHHPDGPALGDLARGLLVWSLLQGVAFGVTLELAGRGRRALKLSLERTLICAFLACALVLSPWFLGHSPLDLEDEVLMGLATCVFGLLVTVVWQAAAVRAVAQLGRRPWGWGG